MHVHKLLAAVVGPPLLPGCPPESPPPEPRPPGVPEGLSFYWTRCLGKNPLLRALGVKRLADELAPFASDPKASAARIADWEELAPQSSPTLVAVVYEALRKEKQDGAFLSDADATGPRTALAREALRREGGVDVSEPRLVDMAPSVRDVMKSEPPPAVVRTLPPPPERDAPTLVKRRPAKWTLGMHPMTLVGASACIVVASVIAASVIRRGPETSTSTTTAAAIAPPPAPEPREAPPPAIAPANTAPQPAVMAASALPEAPATAPAPAPKRVLKKAAASAAAPAAEPAAPRAEKPATQKPAPEPKADDDLRKFLDDRR